MKTKELDIARAIRIVAGVASTGDCYRRFKVTETEARRREGCVKIVPIRKRDDAEMLCALLTEVLRRPAWADLKPRLEVIVTGVDMKRWLKQFVPTRKAARPWKWIASREGIAVCPRKDGLTYKVEHMDRLPWFFFHDAKVQIAVTFCRR